MEHPEEFCRLCARISSRAAWLRDAMNQSLNRKHF
jgi:hypothetical protein